MKANATPELLWNCVAEHFAQPALLSRVRAMSAAEVQIEGWWKAELIYLLQSLHERHLIAAWDRECSAGISGARVDFEVHERDTTFVIEVKTALCRTQKGVPWKLVSYVMGPKHGFIMTDVLKLSAIKCAMPRHQCLELIFAYPSPEANEWQGLVRAISIKAPDPIVTVARLDQLGSAELSIGWLSVDHSAIPKL